MSESLVNVSNPAAFGVEWAGESGGRFQLVNIRGTRSLMFGARPAGQTRWISTSVVNPERFGMAEPPRMFGQFRKVAEAFTNV